MIKDMDYYSMNTKDLIECLKNKMYEREVHINILKFLYNKLNPNTKEEND